MNLTILLILYIYIVIAWLPDGVSFYGFNWDAGDFVIFVLWENTFKILSKAKSKGNVLGKTVLLRWELLTFLISSSRT